MIRKWSKEEFESFKKEIGNSQDPDLNSLIAMTRLVGAEKELTLHGGGNTSVKTRLKNRLGEELLVLLVKASGAEMAFATSETFVPLDLNYLRKIRMLGALSDEEMKEEFLTHRLSSKALLPSIESLMHAFMDAKFVCHTHPALILALTNRRDAGSWIQKIGGGGLLDIPYTKSGFELAEAVANKANSHKDSPGLIIRNHGLVTWGDTAEEACKKTLEIVKEAQALLLSETKKKIGIPGEELQSKARELYLSLAPLLRGLLSPNSLSDDRPFQQVILKSLIDPDILSVLEDEEVFRMLETYPLTPDYLIRTKPLPLLIPSLDFDDLQKAREQLETAIHQYEREYETYAARYQSQASEQNSFKDLLPKVVFIKGVGAVCVGDDESQANMVADITRQAVLVKKVIYETEGRYASLSEDHVADMEFRSFQRAKLGGSSSPLKGTIALVTGAAGAIGSGICEKLLESGSHLAFTDLPGPGLDQGVKKLGDKYPGKVLGICLDVTDPVSVTNAFKQVIAAWGGIDLVIINAGIAHVQSLAEMDLEAFRRLEKVNVEGTLNLIREAARIFKIQATAGDIVLISTKNVFAPGAKFGAYSATKAASHQLARIASLELAEIGVRVNMVAPDAVFSHGDKKSGLWATVGPDRMKARGLDEEGLEEYYRSRNLLKAKVTAEHVARAVLYFAKRETPTTGATLPIDGGLPDATPR